MRFNLFRIYYCKCRNGVADGLLLNIYIFKQKIRFLVLYLRIIFFRNTFFYEIIETHEILNRDKKRCTVERVCQRYSRRLFQFSLHIADILEFRPRWTGDLEFSSIYVVVYIGRRPIRRERYLGAVFRSRRYNAENVLVRKIAETTLHSS